MEAWHIIHTCEQRRTPNTCKQTHKMWCPASWVKCPSEHSIWPSNHRSAARLCSCDTDANVYQHSSQDSPSAAITHYLHWLTHTLPGRACLHSALSVIFNPQDGFVAFVCHRITGLKLWAPWLWRMLLFGCRVNLPNLFLIGGQRGTTNQLTDFAFGLIHFIGKSIN